MLHHLLHAVQPVVVADPVDQRRQQHVGRIELRLVHANELVHTRGRGADVVVEMDWPAE